MGKNIRNINSKFKFLFKILFIFTLLFVVFLAIQNKLGISIVEANDEVGGTTILEPFYLSDIPDSKILRKRVGYGSFNNNMTVSVKIEGGFYSFDKGIWAHATSDIVYDITEYSNNYDNFTAYLGINNTSNAGNGVIFQIYVSNDVTNWGNPIGGNIKKMPGENATHVEIPIKGKKYLRLVADANGANGNDHSVYADAKLIKDGYKEPGEDDVPSITDLDTVLKSTNINENTDIATYIKQHPDYELALLQRTFIKRAGPYALRRFIAENEENKNTLNWLMYNSEAGKDDTTQRDKAENLRLYLLGGAPDGGNYYNSLTQLSRLYDEYSIDFENDTVINNDLCPEGMTRGDLYKKMAITLSLTHTQTVGLWMQAGNATNKSDALKRYAIYKYMYENEKFDLTAIGEGWNIAKWFEALNVEEMRFIMNNLIDDEEILWLNAYVQDNIDKYRVYRYITPHPYIAYVWPNYGDSRYYAEENKDYFNKLFAVNKTNDNTGTELTGEYAGKVGLFDTEFTIPGGKNNQTYTFKVTRGTADNKIYKVWMNFRNKFGTGCVCGGISKSGSNIRATHGIPATVIGQPGHAALLYYTKNMDPTSPYYGKGYWNIDNDVSGWTLSEKGERMLLGWGNNRSYATGYTVVYMQLAQEALNDYQNFEKAEEVIMLADVYSGNLENQTEIFEKQELIYRKALTKQPINIDAWYNLILLYNANNNKTEDQFYALAEEIAEALKDFPLPMYQLTNLIKPHLTTVQNTYKFTLLQTNTLTEASTLPNSATSVYQPSLTRLEANHLLGKVDKSIATFSFDGIDAGKLVFASKFDGNGFRFEYSLAVDENGKRIWKSNNSFAAEEEHKWQLTREEIASITSANDIYINIEGVIRDPNDANLEDIFKIDITDGDLPANLFANDLENRVVGVNLNTEWRYTENDPWISYGTASPDLTGDKTVQVRQPATGTKLASTASPIYTFTPDNQPDTRKYIQVSHLSIAGVSTQATNNGGAATNAIDANYNTRYHSAWNGTDTERYIIIELDYPVYLSAVEFVPAGGGNR